MKYFLLFVVLITSNVCYSNDTLTKCDKAYIFLYFKKALEFGGINLQINNFDIGRIKQGERIKIELYASDKFIELRSSNKRIVTPLKFKPELGKSYYVEVSVPGEILFTLKEPKIGEKEFNDNSYFIDDLNQLKVISEKSDNLIISDTITYRSKPVLDYSDFRAEKPKDSSSCFYLDISIATFIKSINVWTGRQTLESFAGIRRDLSWIDSNTKTDEQLIYAQLKYDIANYFSKLAENRMNKNKSQIGLQERIKSIIEEEQLFMKKTFKKMDDETDFGKKKEETQYWIDNYEQIIINNR